MNRENKEKSTYDKFIEKLTPQKKEAFDEEYQKLLFSELSEIKHTS